MISLEELKSVLDYDADAGIFKWKIRPRQRACSNIAGSVNPYGYIQICIKQKIYRAHRLAWFYFYGKWPDQEVDHINGNKDDNRICNLRLADKQKNQANSKMRSGNLTGFKGVFTLQDNRKKKYCSRITVDHKTIWLGNFYTPEEAHAAYCNAANMHFGDFARYA